MAARPGRGLMEPIGLRTATVESVERDVRAYVEMLKRGEPFSTTKINHGFWEQLLAVGWPDVDLTDDGRRRLDEQLNRPALFETGFIDELFADLAGLPGADPAFHFGVSATAFANSDRIVGQTYPAIEVSRLIDSILPPHTVVEDGNLWRNAALTGALSGVYEALADRDLVVVGPAHLEGLGRFVPSRRFRYLPIHPTAARFDRREIEQRIRDLEPGRDGPTVVLLQAATLATWLVFRLHRTLPDTTLLDLGRAPDLWFPEVVRAQPWSAAVTDSLQRIHGLEYRTPGQVKVHDELQAVVGPPLGRPAWEPPDDEGPVRFVENKPVDHAFVAEVLKASAAVNQWSNFGPVSRRFEQALGAWLELDNRAVVATSSGTAALWATVALHEHLADRRLRWAVAGFSFECTRQGPLGDAVVLDCDEDGMLSVDALNDLDPGTIDGLVVTNVFGQAADLDVYHAWCVEHGAVLVSDSALALDAGYRTADHPLIPEIISFHHTKPWGMGEGGCALVPREHEDVFRSLINFGLYKGIRTGARSSNAKMSEFAAAYGLARLRDFTPLMARYRSQYRRIARVAMRVGFDLLIPLSRLEAGATPGSVPLLASGAVRPRIVADGPLPARKFYRPVADGLPTAARIHRRIVNIPCHPGMERYGLDEIEAGLRALQIEL